MNTSPPAHFKLLLRFVVIFILSFFIIIILVFYSYRSQPAPQPVSTSIHDQPAQILTPSIMPSLLYPTPTSTPVTKLVYRSGDKTETLYTFMPSASPVIYRWNNYLLINTRQYEDVRLKIYDMDSNRTSVIDLSVNDPLLAYGYINTVQVIGNELYISTGGYLMKGAVFYSPLPPDGKPVKLTDSRNASIRQVAGRYWIVGGEGDSCWSETDYSLYDLESKKITPVTTSYEGCTAGEEFIGLDSRDRMIMASHEASNYDRGGIYKYVIAINLDNPSIKDGLIAKQNMPENITYIVYVPGSEELFLYGPAAYTFSINTGRLEKTLDIAGYSANSTIQWNANRYLCITNRDNDQMSAIDTVQKNIVDGKICSQTSYNTNGFNSKELPGQLSQRLPSGYELIQE